MAVLKTVRWPVTGIIHEVVRPAGESVKSTDVVIVIESMKMHFDVRAEADGTVGEIFAGQGDSVSEGEALLTIKQSS